MLSSGQITLYPDCVHSEDLSNQEHSGRGRDGPKSGVERQLAETDEHDRRPAHPAVHLRK